MATGTEYVCGECGRPSLRWEGRCPGCSAWNSLAEAPAPRPAGSGSRRRSAPPPAPLEEAKGEAAARRPVGFGDLDLVLGGGLVAGSVVLLGGPPGIGKSTLLLQVGARLRAGGAGGDGPAASVLYVSGEESAEQVRLRARRVGGGAERVLYLGETSAEAVVAVAEQARPALLCVDSIQTQTSQGLASAPGTVNQVRECAGVLQAFAKRTGTPTVIVGHVTKGGALAGPRALEHLVDVVLRFEGPPSGEYRILRTAKNRFGSSGEVAVFRMTGQGLEPVADSATAFLTDRPSGVSGSAVAAVLEGSRPLLAEVQALAAPSHYGTPQRSATGFSARRLGMLLAVLERRSGLAPGAGDVYVNVVGGLRLRDPAADLAVVAALASAALDRPLPEGIAFIGEVGLGGEVRGAAGLERRVRELERAGLESIALPASAARPDSILSLRPVAHVRDLVRLVRA